MSINILENPERENIGVVMNFLTEQAFSRKYNTFSIPFIGFIDYIKSNELKKIYIESEIYESDHDWFKKKLSDLLTLTTILNIEVVIISFNDERLPNEYEGYNTLNINLKYNNERKINEYPLLVDEYNHNPVNNKTVFDILYFGLPNNQYTDEQVEFHRKKGLKVKKIDISSIDRNTVMTVLDSIRKSKIVYFYDMSKINHKFIYYIDVIATLRNSNVIYHDNENINLTYGNKYPLDESIFYIIEALSENALFRDKNIISKTRKALLNNTLISYSKENLEYQQDNSVSVIISTKRKEYIRDFIQQTNAQKFVNLQIILITHGFTLTNKEKKSLNSLSIFEITFIECSKNTSFGNCLNTGIEKVENNYVIKMDDDDYYYPNFVIDLLLGLKYSKAKIVGKYGFFFYLEDENVVGQRRLEYQYCNIAEVKGNTMICKTETLQQYKFSDLSRHVDSDFLQRIREDDGYIYCIHPYDMCVFRASNKQSHTYQVHDSKFLRDATILYYGKPNSTISSEII